MVAPDGIVDTIREDYPDVQAIYLFGSSGTEHEWPDSDVDIGILLPPDQAKALDPSDLLQTQLRLSSFLHKDVDLLNLRRVSTVFQKEVVMAQRRIYTADAYAADEFEMLTLSFYQKLNEERADILYPCGRITQREILCPMNDVILNKKISIERCIKQIQTYYAIDNGLAFDEDYLKQDAIAMNLQRMCELSILWQTEFLGFDEIVGDIDAPDGLHPDTGPVCGVRTLRFGRCVAVRTAHRTRKDSAGIGLRAAGSSWRGLTRRDVRHRAVRRRRPETRTTRSGNLSA